MQRHLLVTNDFPPKIGGIQSYLWELWRRLPPESVTVLTTPHRAAAPFDAAQPMRIVRTRERVLLPHRGLIVQIRDLADEVGADLVMLDPALPLGALGPRLGLRYGVVLHGAEITVPARLPVLSGALRHVMRSASLVVSAGGYAAGEALRCAGSELPIVEVPPGVDTDRFRPLVGARRDELRARFGLDQGPLVVGLSRLVPRKGFDVVIDAVDEIAAQHDGLQLAIAGAGRDRARLERRARRSRATVSFLGRVSSNDVAGVVAMADVFAAPCRSRWAGLEQEGFGIVFVEAAACGVAAVAGRSGGSHEAVEHGRTGFVVDRPGDASEVAKAIDGLLRDPAKRIEMGHVAREMAESSFSYEHLAKRLSDGLALRAPPKSTR